jgi:regulator of protease activity HflC (stomatin/prohibitin superfamily)
VTTPVARAWEQALRLAFGFLFAAVALLTVAWAGSNLRVVPADARAAVLRLGVVTRIEGPGLLLAWPQPFEQVVLLPGADRQIARTVHRFDSMPVGRTGYLPEFPMSQDVRSNAAFLLTGETGIVHLQATLFYRIEDPRSYLLAAPHVTAALERIFGASAVAVCATRGLDSILVTHPDAGIIDARSASRESFRSDLVRETNRRLDALTEQGAGLGVRISRVDIATALPGGTKVAYDQVLLASQAADGAIAKAKTEATRVATAAREQRLRTLADAAAQAAERRAEAVSTATLMAALTSQIQGNADAAQRRTLYDARVGALLNRAREVSAVDPQGTSRLLLPGPGTSR